MLFEANVADESDARAAAIAKPRIRASLAWATKGTCPAERIDTSATVLPQGALQICRELSCSMPAIPDKGSYTALLATRNSAHRRAGVGERFGNDVGTHPQRDAPCVLSDEI